MGSCRKAPAAEQQLLSSVCGQLLTQLVFLLLHLLLRLLPPVLLPPAHPLLLPLLLVPCNGGRLAWNRLAGLPLAAFTPQYSKGSTCLPASCCCDWL